MKNPGRNPPRSGKRKQDHRKTAPKGGGPPHPPLPSAKPKARGGPKDVRLSAYRIGRWPFWHQREPQARTAALPLPLLAAACQIPAAVF